MEKEKKKFALSGLKKLGEVDVKDIGSLFKKKDSSNINEIQKKKVRKEKPRNVVSIDFGSSYIKVVEGKFQNDTVYITKVAKINTPEGCIKDGKILNSQVVVNTLGFLIKQENIKAKDVVFTTNSSMIINRDILIPVVKEEEMETVIRYEIQQYLPINLDDYIIQFITLDEVKTVDSVKLKVNVTAFPEKMAYEYYNVINLLDLNPYSLDVNYNSISKLANNTLDNSQGINGTVAFVDMGATSINVAIFKNGKLDFNRIIKSGGNNIDHDLSESLNMSIKSTESVKIEQGNLLSEDSEDVANLTIKSSVNELLEDLERILQFYNNKFTTAIDVIHIYGGLSNLKGLEDYIQERLSRKVERPQMIDNVEIAKNLAEEKFSQYLNAVGAIIRL